MTLFNKILCFFGWHDWEYGEGTYYNARTCNACGLYEPLMKDAK